jgi:hypothetical protein
MSDALLRNILTKANERYSKVDKKIYKGGD